MGNAFFNGTIKTQDAALFAALEHELHRQQHEIELIASENLASMAVMQAQGSVLTNKYAEGYPGKRYYGGCAHVDVAEQLAQQRACQLFNCAFANVQPHSGSQANQAVFLSVLNPGDSILGMALDHGGHLTHGAKVNVSGKWFDAHTYGLNPETGLLDYEDVARKAEQHKPKLIIAGASAYARQIDFARFGDIAKSVGAYLLVDMAHIAGLVAAGLHPNPFPHADFVTTTTHKTLRGPRGGMVLTNDEALAKKVNSALFPGLQGGPLMHVIAAKAVAFGEALQPGFKHYAQRVIDNAQALAESVAQSGAAIVTGGTENHIVLVDLRPLGLTGKDAEKTLEQAGLTCNKNSVPFDTASPMVTSGIRLGSPAATTRGFGTTEFTQVGQWIGQVLNAMQQGNPQAGINAVQPQVRALCEKFPIYTEACR